MEQALTEARAWLAAIHPALPALVLIFAIWLPQWAIRRWLPQVWEAPVNVVFGGSDLSPALKGLRKAWQAIPSVAAAALLTSLSSGGDTWQAVTGAAIGLAAPAWHELLKALPAVPYRGGMPPAAVLALALGLVLPACSSWKPVARTVNDVAGELCSIFFAERQGISIEDAARTFCRTRDQLEPWIDQVLAAKQAASKAALERSGAAPAP